MSCVHHVSLGTNDYPKARAFYDAVMAALAMPLQMETPTAASWGRDHPEFWITTPHEAAPATPGNGTHVCFAAPNRARRRRLPHHRPRPRRHLRRPSRPASRLRPPILRRLHPRSGRQQDRSDVLGCGGGVRNTSTIPASLKGRKRKGGFRSQFSFSYCSPSGKTAKKRYAFGLIEQLGKLSI